MSPHFSAPPLSLVLHLCPPSPPPLLLPVITQEKLQMCTGKRGVDAHLGCDLFG